MVVVLDGHALARQVTVSVTGQAVVVAGNLAAARPQAVNQALRRAVEQVFVAQGGVREGVDPVADQWIYDRAVAFVASSAVTSEVQDDNVLNLTMTVVVDADDLAAQLATRKKARKAEPVGRRVLVLATEQLGPARVFGWRDFAFGPGGLATRTAAAREVNDSGTLEATLSAAFSDAGYTVVDPTVLHGKLAPRPAFEALDLATPDARVVAQRTDADLVIVARGIGRVAGVRVGEMVSGQGNVVARLVRIRDGKVLATTTQHAAQVHLDGETASLLAVDEAAKRAAAELLARVGPADGNPQ